MCVCKCLWKMCVCLRLHAYIHVNTNTYAMCTCTYICLYKHAYLHIYLHMYVNMYVCVYIHMYIYIYVYTYVCMCNTGLPGHELGHRIGIAKADYTDLQKDWKHFSLPVHRKVHMYKTLVASKLMCGLSCLCLSAAERRRLDGFQNRCLRRITGIPPSFVSRVPNTAVLHRARCNAASDMIVQRQLLLSGKVLRSPLDHLLHVSAFIPDVRRVGRPRREWVSEVRGRVFDYSGAPP